jgi:glucose/arabinose dehydrogenase
VLRNRFVNIAPVKNISSCLIRFVINSVCGLLATAFLIMATAKGSDAGSSCSLKLVAEGFVSPVNLVSLPDGSGRLLIGDQVGTIHVLNKDGKLSDQLFFNARDRLTKLPSAFDERGLLGIALHPRFKENRKIYLYYSAPLRPSMPTNWNHTSRLSEFKVTANDFAKLDPASERVLLEIDEPQMNHNCGRLAFGPDGFLYIGVGDGGGANDGVGKDNELGHAPQGNGQDTTTLLGKILRIDVDRGEPYAIPADNPFADGAKGRKEIFAYGLRNPWGISFDRGGTHELFAADVGQNLWEELNIVVKGGNYGWRVREGFHGFNPQDPDRSPTNAPTTDAAGRPFIDPVLEYKHPPRNRPPGPEPQGISVTGGYVYRGKMLPELQGRYVFADWSRSWALPDGVLFVATRDSAGPNAKWSLESLKLASPARINAYIVAFGEDDEGELYILTNGRNSLTGQTGKVFKLVPM